MKVSIVAVVTTLAAVAVAAPHNRGNNNNNDAATNDAANNDAANDNGGNDVIAGLQATFDRNNPNGTPAAAGDPDDLNGDGVINFFEAGAQADKRDNSGSDIIADLQSTFDRNNPNGTPAAPGDPDDLNGDGVINIFEAGAQADKRDNSGSDIIADLQATFDRNNPNGTPTAPGNPDDLNGDGVINIFEAGAQADRR